MLRLATYNFLSGGSRKRDGHWRVMRERIAPHILFAQECRTAGSQFKHKLHRDALARRWGTGVFSEDARLKRIVIDDFDGWVVGGQLPRRMWLTKRPVRAFSIHCPAGDHGYIRTMHLILDRLSAIAEDADLVLAGDFNVVTGLREPNDVIRMSRGERVLLERMRDELKLLPCWQTANPGQPLAQTLRWTGNRAAPYHCDGIFIPETWRDRLRSCTIHSGPEWDALSDHNPVVVEIETGRG